MRINSNQRLVTRFDFLKVRLCSTLKNLNGMRKSIKKQGRERVKKSMTPKKKKKERM